MLFTLLCMIAAIASTVQDGLLDPAQGTQIMDQLAAIARHLAVDAINKGIAQQCDAVIINTAQLSLTDGDALMAAGAFKDAVNKYKDALAKAESC